MKKKKQTPATSISTPISSADLKALIHDYSLFFDKLIELIPAKFYLPNDDADSKPWYQGLSKAKKASLKQQTRENIKLARRNRHDPDKISQSSTLGLLKQSLTEARKTKPDYSGNADVSEDPKMGPVGFDEIETNNGVDYDDNKSITYEELRQRLRKKIELLRGNRGGEKSAKKENNSINNNDIQEKKRKRDNDDGDNAKGEGGNVGSEVLEKGIEFGKVKMGEEEKVNKKNKRKIPKEKELERVSRLQEMKRENPVVAAKESWKAATSRAMGEKVHDDPKLLKESIRKEKRRRVKNAEKWKERVERTTKMKQDRQQKRNSNIAERARDKKARKIAKREKKLLRPGFEGRKESYITQD